MISMFAGEERDAKRQSLKDPLVVQQQLCNLSDDALEYQALDRMSFLRFLGLEHSAVVPDAKTICVRRDRLKTHDLIGTIRAAVSGQLDRSGLIARGGQIIDASIVSAPIQRNTREENAAIKDGEVPQDWSAAKRAQKDVDARWTKKHGKAFYRYKLHANTDRRGEFIRRHDVTPAQVHDRQRFETLLDPLNDAPHGAGGQCLRGPRTRSAVAGTRVYGGHTEQEPRGQAVE